MLSSLGNVFSGMGRGLASAGGTFLNGLQSAGNAFIKNAPGIMNSLAPAAQAFAPLAAQLAPMAISALGQKIGGQNGMAWGNMIGNMASNAMGFPQFQQQLAPPPSMPNWMQQGQQMYNQIAPQGFNTPFSQMAGNAMGMGANAFNSMLGPQAQQMGLGQQLAGMGGNLMGAYMPQQMQQMQNFAQSTPAMGMQPAFNKMGMQNPFHDAGMMQGFSALPFAYQ